MLLGGDGASGAEAAAEVLGSLRGLAAKLGQMGSYVDGIVPEKQREAYENSLRMLRAQAPRSSTPEIRAFVEAELGGTIESLFLEWNDEPIASASIGQVHAAKLPGGTEVAVKVQHPKVRQAVESDLKNAGMLETLAGAMGGRRFDSKALLEVVRSRFREELDYRLEGTRIQDFARIHGGDPTIRIPRLIEERSSGGVLTTEFVRGLDFEEACVATEEERRAWARTMWRFVFKGILAGGMFNADPHPGNYIFQSDGKVVFLDFGCVQLIPDTHRPFARAVHRAAIRKDVADFRANVSLLIGARPGALETMACDYCRTCFEPIYGSPYRITREYAGSLVSEMKDMGLKARKLPASEFFTMPSDMLFMNRLQFGFFSVLARLDVEVDYRAVEDEFLSKLESETVDVSVLPAREL